MSYNNNKDNILSSSLIGKSKPSCKTVKILSDNEIVTHEIDKENTTGIDKEKEEDDNCYYRVNLLENETNGEELYKEVEAPVKKTNNDLIYTIYDDPTWPLSFVLGLQHYLTMVGGTMALPLLIAPDLCIKSDNPVIGIFISTIIFVSGMVTVLQTLFGVRLPIVQGGSFEFIIPTLAILKAHGECKYSDDMTEAERDNVWLERVREIQGSIIVASLFQVFVGATGLIGLLLKWITPLSIVPTITLVGIALVEPASSRAGGCWPITIMTTLLLILFSQFLTKKTIKIPNFGKRKNSPPREFPLFALFPILLGVAISWSVAGVLTATGALADNSTARTDIKLNIIRDAPWIYVPYPFQFGFPTVSISTVIGMLTGVIVSLIESIGDYYACARIVGAPPPPIHAVNRGVTMEGLGCTIAGIWGTCNGTTSYSENIGALRISKAGSRRVILCGGLLMMGFGVFGKFGAFCATIPDPVLAGIFILVFSMITAVGLSNLQLVDLNSSRNLFVLGTSLFLALLISGWVGEHKDAIQTGSETVDQILNLLLSNSMLIGCVLGIVLDNSVPGTPEERGIHKWNDVGISNEDKAKSSDIYDLPILMDFIKRHSFFEKIPLSPTFQMKSIKCGKENEC